MPQETKITFQRLTSLNLRWPYQATVMNKLDKNNNITVHIALKLEKLWLMLTFLAFINCGCQKEARYSNSYGPLPTLKTDSTETDSLSRAFHLAIGTIAANVRPYQLGLLNESTPVLFAGFDYFGPWSRDGAVNATHLAGVLMPEVLTNTLLSQVKEKEKGKLVFGGEYWDNVRLVEAFWTLYCATGDKELLKVGFSAAENTLKDRINNEFDSKYGLFRGPAGFNDGVSAYPDIYSRTGKYSGGNWVSNIKKWPENLENAQLKAQKGFGIPMMALSTNCIYFKALSLMPEIAKELGAEVNEEWGQRAESLKKAINTHFWSDSLQSYRFLVDPLGNCDRAEGEGLALAILYEVADGPKAQRILANTYQTPAGIPCIWPAWDRYIIKPNIDFPRHSGVVWSQIMGFWAFAAAQNKDSNGFLHQFENLKRRAIEQGAFHEIYHPYTLKPYGGIQENNEGKNQVWESSRAQTWAASSFIRMVCRSMCGMNLTPKGLAFKPFFPKEYPNFQLRNLTYRNMVINLTIKGKGSKIKSFKLNGASMEQPILTNDLVGLQNLDIVLGE